MKNLIKILGIILIIALIVLVIFFVMKPKNVDVNIEYNYYKYYSNEKFGVIDKNGNVVLEANYQEVIIPNPTYAKFFLLEDEKIKKVVNENDEEIFTEYEKVLPIPVTGLIGEIPYEKQVLIYEENGKQGLIDFNGKKILNAEFNVIESLPYKEGELLCKTDDNVYIIDENGKEKIKLESDIDIFADGYYEENNLDKSGYIISKQTSEGVLYGYLNHKGKKILDLEYDKIERIPTEKNYLIVQKNGKYGLYKNEDVIINCNYQEMKYEESINLYFVRRGSSYGVLNENGNIVVPVEYKSLENKGIFIEAVTTDDEKTKYTLKGEKTNKFDEYNSIEKSKYDNTYIGITQQYEYNILDSNYNIVISNGYEYIENIIPSRYIVRDSNGKYGMVNEQNIKLIENKYDVIQVINTSEVIQAMEISDDMVLLFDKNGNKIFEEQSALVILNNGYIKVFCNDGIKYFTLQGKEISNKEIYKSNNIIAFYENGKWGFKDKNDEIIVEAKYDRIVEINQNGYGGIKLEDKWGIIDKDGNVIVEPKFYIDDSITDPEFLNKFYKNYYASVGAFYVE